MQTYIHPTAIIGPNVEIGLGNYIGPYCVIGMPAEMKCKFPQDGKVIIGNNNMITGSSTIDAGSEGVTIIGNDNFIMKQIHLGHDVIIGNKVVVAPHATIGDHCILEDYSYVGMGAILTKKLELKEEFLKLVGNPAKIKGKNIYLINKLKNE